jgi:3-oxoacyl-[acyl-carrier protein] reductase
MLLQGKTALVTGGARGIGEAVVRKFAEQGAKVAFTYVSAGSAARSEALAAELGPNVKAYQSDAGDFAQAEALAAQVLKDFGGLDILVNNAGITRDTLMLRMSEEQWDEVMRTNLKSVFNMTKHCLRHMIRSGGAILNMSSVVGIFGQQGQANYAASKAGIIGFSKSIAKEYGSRNIRCARRKNEGKLFGRHPVETPRRGGRCGKYLRVFGLRHGRLYHGAGHIGVRRIELLKSASGLLAVRGDHFEAPHRAGGVFKRF